MNVDKIIAHDPNLGPVMMRVFYTKAQVRPNSPRFSPGETDILVGAGWQRRGNHASGKTDIWAHPVHSPRSTVAPEERVSVNDRGDRQVVIVPVERTRWRHFTREEALTLEGHRRTDRVPRF